MPAVPATVWESATPHLVLCMYWLGLLEVHRRFQEPIAQVYPARTLLPCTPSALKTRSGNGDTSMQAGTCIGYYIVEKLVWDPHHKTLL